MSALRRKRIPLSVALAGGLLLVGCANSTGTSSADSAASSDTSTPPSVVKVSPSAQNAFAHKWTYEVTEPQGYVFTGTLEDGDVRRFEPGLALNGLPVGSACQIDATTDGIIPARFTITNRTNGFPLNGVLQNLSMGNVSRNAGGFLEAEVGYSTPSCSDNVMTISFGTLAPGQSGQVSIFFVLMGYYSPAHPEGDPTMRQRAGVIIGELGASKVSGNGPGITINPSDVDIPISG